MFPQAPPAGPPRPPDIEGPGIQDPDVGGTAVAARPSGRVAALVRGVRVRQWPKNLLVFVAPAAARVLQHGGPALHAVGACAVFTAAASGTYLLNDVLDAEADRHHPEKRHRPVASGALPERMAVAGAVVLLASAVGSAWLLAGWVLAAVIGAYVTVSVAYSVRLKHEPVIELAAVASGFVLRAIAGGASTHVPLSSWFLVVTCFGALFIVTGKRAAEHRSLGDGRGVHRPSLALYTPSFLRSTLTLSAAVTVTAYCLWAFERAGQLSHAHHLVLMQLTVVPVVLGLLHVLRLLDAGEGGSPEELVFRDRFLQVMGVLWVVLFALGLYA